ncbi:hypothetical protein CVT24_004631 [Panaeolus cyanescens]|uniref:Nicotinamide-nucleotide adenylyltransferase n=1 Tax=Panaeolus cyanescens TaxID=181874 RepID=A0A409YSH7_9AGAR|nr:hypothetical protein CVT24_004631 [Panaeolus cyanescens]
MQSSLKVTAAPLLQRLQQGLARPPVELVQAPNLRWPFHANHNRNTLRIAILDSSFNPPTLAHLALANAARPTFDKHKPNHEAAEEDYDAKLLLLSVKNVDKTLKPGDATYIQRLEMMELLAKHIRHHPPVTTTRTNSETGAPNVAIAIIDEPTFIGKSQVLLEFLRRRFQSLSTSSEDGGSSTEPPEIELTFLVGKDTLERLFAPRYYASESFMVASLRKFMAPAPYGDNSRVVCAHRVSTSTIINPSAAEAEEAQARRTVKLAQEFVDNGRIAMIEIGDKLSRYSSSAVRGAIHAVGIDDRDGREAVWKSLVSKDVAQYITDSRLYVNNL